MKELAMETTKPAEENDKVNHRDKRDIQISKALSYLLRHAAVKEHLPIDSNGYVPIDTILNHNRLKTHRCTLDDLKRVVESNDKRRFVIDDSGTKIAATQGHSMSGIEPDSSMLTRVTLASEQLPESLIHGTNVKNTISILESGRLSKMRRNHVHLSSGVVGVDPGVVSGMRHSSTVYIYLKRDELLAAGENTNESERLNVFRSLNGVYLVDDSIPLKYFSKIAIKKSAQRDSEYPKLIELLNTKYSDVPYEII